MSDQRGELRRTFHGHRTKVCRRASEECENFFNRANIQVVPFTQEQARLASQAFLEFGKGRHPAGLNFGDCFSYALAKATGEPLLLKGDDFSKTDLLFAA